MRDPELIQLLTVIHNELGRYLETAGDAAVEASLPPEWDPSALPPIPPVAPAAATAPLAPPAGDLDGQGVAYDPEIHSEGKTMTKAGTWRLKRGVAPAPPAVPAPPAGDLPGIPAPAPIPEPPAPSAPAAAPAIDAGSAAVAEVVRAMTSGQTTREQVLAALMLANLPDLSALKSAAPEIIAAFRAGLA